MARHSKYPTLLAGIALAFLLMGGFFLFQQTRNDDVECTAEAMICSDGTTVGRQGPSCEFAPCPTIDDSLEEGWVEVTDEENSISFQHPEKFPTSFIKSVDWPPQVQVTDGPLTCTEAGNPSDRAGRTEVRVISGKTYCVTEIVEGAAGSVYTQYAYAFEQNGKVIIFTFSTRAPQCENFDPQAQNACENERRTFNVDSFIHSIVRTLEVR